MAARVQEASTEVMAASEGGVFVTSAVRDDLSGSPLQSRLRSVALDLREARFSGIEVYRLD